MNNLLRLPEDIQKIFIKNLKIAIDDGFEAVCLVLTEWILYAKNFGSKEAMGIKTLTKFCVDDLKRE